MKFKSVLKGFYQGFLLNVFIIGITSANMLDFEARKA